MVKESFHSPEQRQSFASDCFEGLTHLSPEDEKHRPSQADCSKDLGINHMRFQWGTTPHMSSRGLDPGAFLPVSRRCGWPTTGVPSVARPWILYPTSSILLHPSFCVLCVLCALPSLLHLSSFELLPSAFRPFICSTPWFSYSFAVAS